MILILRQNRKDMDLITLRLFSNYTRTFKRVDVDNITMDHRKKLFNKSGDSVEIKEDGKDLIVTHQYTTKVEAMKSATQDNFNDLVSVYESTGFTEEPRQ